jgi:hypothetical protein
VKPLNDGSEWATATGVGDENNENEEKEKGDGDHDETDADDEDDDDDDDDNAEAFSDCKIAGRVCEIGEAAAEAATTGTAIALALAAADVNGSPPRLLSPKLPASMSCAPPAAGAGARELFADGDGGSGGGAQYRNNGSVMSSTVATGVSRGGHTGNG